VKATVVWHPFSAALRLVGRRRAGGPAAPALILALWLLAGLSAVPSALASSPTLAIDPAPTHSLVTAHLSGDVAVPADGYETYWCLETAPAGTQAWSGFCYQGPLQPGETAPVQQDVSGLSAETEYEARLSALNTAEWVEEHSPTVSFTTDPATPPTLTLVPADAVSATTAHLSGTIDPEGGNEDAHSGLLPIGWQLQIARENPSSNELEGWSGVGAGELSTAEPEGGGTPPAASNSPITVEAEATGLQPNSHYQFRLVARYAGLRATSSEEGFDTGALEPDVERETLWEPTETSIQLNALVNPHNSELTDCHFEWGAGSSLDHSTPCELQYAPQREPSPEWWEGDPYAPPAGEGFTMVAARISGLDPGTDYSFRLVAANATGTQAEDVRSFETLREPVAEDCPNAAIRHQQHADQVPDCRAFEMATPVEKGNGDVVADSEGLTTVAAEDGNALGFDSRTPFGDTMGSGNSGHTTYVARRSAAGWTAHGVTPTDNPESSQTGFASTRSQLFSEDLGSLTIWAYDLPAVENDTPKRQNIYAENTFTRQIEAVSPVPLSEPYILQFSGGPFTWGESADGRHIAFEATTRYLPDATENAPNVYQWDEGVLSLVGILPNGEIPASGSWTKPGPRSSVHTMSVDGSRELFYASTGGPAQLYQRIGGEKTVWVSEPEGSGLPEPEGVELQAASPDGRTVLFTSATPLIAGKGGGLYRWTDGPGPKLTFISAFSSAEEELIGMSDDGRRIFLTSKVWSEGETRLLGGMQFEEYPRSKFGVEGEYTGRARVSHSGRYLAFLTPKGFRGPAPKWEGFVRDEAEASGYFFEDRMYLYDFRNDTLRCVSCEGGGDSAEALVMPLASQSNNGYYDAGFRPRFLAEDGHVFFSSPGALVGEDVNGVPDTYEYDPESGTVSLLSTGRGKASMTFADASASGDNVFIATRQSLAWPDSDNLVDIYDARRGGGFPEPPPAAAPCAGEGCQGSASAGIAGLQAASQAPSKGNVHPSIRRCSKKAAGRHRPHSRSCWRKGKRQRHHHERTVNRKGRVSK